MDSFTEVSRTGFLDNIGNAIKGVLVGIVFFFVSFPLLYWNEGRTDWAEVAKTSVVAPENPDASFEGKFVSVTAKLDSTEKVGDPDFIQPGEWLTVDRAVEMYAWVEKKHTKEEKELGGGTKKTTTYEYKTEWVDDDDVKETSEFKYPQNHENPRCPIKSAHFNVAKATVGGYGFEVPDAELPRGDALALTQGMLLSGGAEATGKTMALADRGVRIEGSYLFAGKGSNEKPQVGDVRISFKALARGLQVTMFGTQSKNALTQFVNEKNERFLRALKGTRDQAIAELALEDAIIRWLLRGAGFLLMWIGMTLILGPIAAVADVIPFMGSASRFVIGLVTFPVALVLTTVTIVVSKILHSPIALAVVAVIVLLMVVYVFTRPKKAPPAPAPAV